MEVIEIAKTTLTEMVEKAGENGVTEGEVTREFVKQGLFDFYGSIDFLKNVHEELGIERTPEHTGKVICYSRPKIKLEQQETAATKMAKKAAQSNTNERKAVAIIGNYRR